MRANTLGFQEKAFVVIYAYLWELIWFLKYAERIEKCGSVVLSEIFIECCLRPAHYCWSWGLALSGKPSRLSLKESDLDKQFEGCWKYTVTFNGGPNLCWWLNYRNQWPVWGLPDRLSMPLRDIEPVLLSLFLQTKFKSFLFFLFFLKIYHIIGRSRQNLCGPNSFSPFRPMLSRVVGVESGK